MAQKISPTLQALLDKVRARQSADLQGDAGAVVTPDSPYSNSAVAELRNIPQSVDGIIYNAEQHSFISLASSGADCVLIGAAGTGKTTCQKGAISALLQSGRVPTISDTLGHKYLSQGTPGIILTSFTRRAVRNLRRAVSSDLAGNCITLHKLLEYSPVEEEVYDEESGQEKTLWHFKPLRDSTNPLPTSIHTVVFDESSMISVELFSQLCAALQHKVQFIFVGDIQQLPPVFGSAILGFKLLSLPVIELTQVYRQALESPIIALATKIRNGEIPYTEALLREGNIKEEHPTQGKLTIHPWKKRLHADTALLTIAAFFKAAYTAGDYDPLEDQILIPFNKACGTDELNKHIANHIAKSEGRIVWEIIAGFNKHYFSVGDLVLYDKEDAEIVDIKRNGLYIGKRAMTESPTLDYWGFDNTPPDAPAATEFDLDNIDAYLDAAANTEVTEKVNTASHIITVRMIDSGEEIKLDKAADINNLLLSFALTVHKSQGSEWRRVFVILHQSHNTMLQRELLYTAVTRAKHELYVICEPDHFEKGVRNQKIKGTTLAEKAEYFKGKIDKNMKEILA